MERIMKLLLLPVILLILLASSQVVCSKDRNCVQCVTPTLYPIWFDFMPNLNPYDPRDDCDFIEVNVSCSSSRRWLCPEECFKRDMFYNGRTWGTMEYRHALCRLSFPFAWEQYDESAAIIAFLDGKMVQFTGAVAMRRFSEEEDQIIKLAALPTVPDNRGPPTISLASLIDLAVQRILHELTVLIELLPTKEHMGRKQCIVVFAYTTRLLIVKLLALVKWLKTSKKFESCASICYFLDTQAGFFIDTADRLVDLARGELPQARLPAFQIPAAVDVLTLGQYPRLPLCIKNRFVSEPPLTTRERTRILKRLNQVVQYRIASVAKDLSPRIKDVVIRNGMLVLTVPGEFDATLTILGEGPTTPWTLLHVNMLVEDYEVGHGTTLVHPLQLNFVHNVVQQRMEASQQPMTEMYDILHSYAQSLQLELLYCQTLMLINDRGMRDHVAIEKYDPKGKELVIAYWALKSNKSALEKGSFQYRIIISPELVLDGDSRPSGGRLRARHHPITNGMPDLDDRTGRLSMERLLSETVAVRVRERLLRIKNRLEILKPSVSARMTGNATPTLTWPLFVAASVEEESNLVIAVNPLNGDALCTINDLDDRNEVNDLAKRLNENAKITVLNGLVERIRIKLMIARYKKAIAQLPVRIVREGQLVPQLSQLSSTDRICLQFLKEETFYLVVTFVPDPERGVTIDFYLMSGIETGQPQQANIVQLKPSQMVRKTPSFREVNDGGRKRRSSEEGLDSKDGPPSKRKRSHWLGDSKVLTSVVAMADDRLAFLRICDELDRKKIKYSPVETEPIVGGLLLKITDFSSALPHTSANIANEFISKMTSCCLRLDTRSRSVFTFACSMRDPPLVPDLHSAEGNATTGDDNLKIVTKVQELPVALQPAYNSTISMSEAAASSLLDRLTIYTQLYGPIRRFAKAYHASLKNKVAVCSYTYHKLVLAYGEHRDQLLIVSYRPANNMFHLTFGNRALNEANVNGDDSRDPSTRRYWNGHVCVMSALNDRFNKYRDLLELVVTLVETTVPVNALHNFVRQRLQSVKTFSQLIGCESELPMVLEASLIAVEERQLRLIYGSIHLEFNLLADEKVAVRDCARNTVTAVGLEQFWKRFVSPEIAALSQQVQRDQKEQSSSTIAPQRPQSPGPTGHQMQSSSSPQAPASVPSSRAVPASPFSACLSVPAHMQLEGNEVAMGSPFASATKPTVPIATAVELTSTRNPILIDHKALVTATSLIDGSQNRVPLEEYLFALTYLWRLGPALQAYRQESHKNPSYVQFRYLDTTADSVRITVLGSVPQQQSSSHEPWTVSFHIFLDPTDFVLRLKLEFAGTNIPSESEVKAAERYFERCVARLHNELALISFVNACRVTTPGAFSALTQIMRTQMDPTSVLDAAGAAAPWRVSLQLVDQTGSGTQRRHYACGLQITASGTAVLILLVIRPSRPMEGSRNVEQKHILPIVYNTMANSLNLKTPPDSAENQAAAAILQKQSEAAQRMNQCCLWPAVRHLMEKYQPT